MNINEQNFRPKNYKNYFLKYLKLSLNLLLTFSSSFFSSFLILGLLPPISEMLTLGGKLPFFLSISASSSSRLVSRMGLGWVSLPFPLPLVKRRDGETLRLCRIVRYKDDINFSSRKNTLYIKV